MTNLYYPKDDKSCVIFSDDASLNWRLVRSLKLVLSKHDNDVNTELELMFCNESIEDSD